jgi:predicted nucleic acid-binding protein
MTALVFVDTNVLVYARDARDASKQKRALEWMEFLWEARCGCLSPQVLHEYYVTVTRKLRPGLGLEEARADVRNLFHWLVRVEPALLIESAWAFQDRARLSYWDALLLGAAQAMGCRTVLSEDLPTGQEIAGLRIVSPFRTRPSELEG